ncbi:hypothetical protein [Streptomyces zhihengii]
MLSDRIAELWGEAQRLRLPVVDGRAQGVSIASLESSFGRKVPTEVAEWFAACNGIVHRPGQTQNDAALIPGYEPLSVEDSIAIRDSCPREAFLLSEFFPLLGSGGGDFYAASYDRATGRSHVASVVVGEECRIASRSISQMVAIFIQCYRDGIFFLDGDGILQADDEIWIQREVMAVRELPL